MATDDTRDQVRRDGTHAPKVQDEPSKAAGDPQHVGLIERALGQCKALRNTPNAPGTMAHQVTIHVSDRPSASSSSPPRLWLLPVASL